MIEKAGKTAVPPAGTMIFSSPMRAPSVPAFTIFALSEMHVRRRTTGLWRQRTLDGQNRLAIGITHSAHPQDLSDVPARQLQEVFEQSSKIWNSPCSNRG